MMNNYFKLEEFLKSSTARKNKIFNLPSFEVIEHIKEMLPLLNELRAAWGSALTITSGFRCEELNAMVGGVKTSAHLKGYAVDLVPANGDLDGFIEFCKEFFENRTDFDQVIIEQVKGDKRIGNSTFNKDDAKRWVHIGLKNSKGEQRHQIFNLAA